MANIITLPNLEVLKIKDNGFLGDVWMLNDEEIFKQLKFLLISWTCLKHWKAGSANFPKLQRLFLKRCMNLEEIPQDFGEICTLESIEFHKCSISAAKSGKDIQENRRAWGMNVLVSSSIIIRYLQLSIFDQQSCGENGVRMIDSTLQQGEITCN